LHLGRRGKAKRRSIAFALNFSLFLSFLSREKKEKDNTETGLNMGSKWPKHLKIRISRHSAGYRKLLTFI
jgi:hypothetical protein